jgi:hypothetical protein
MKIEINNKEQNTEIKFPCLMETNGGHTVILATSETGGVYLCGICLKGTFPKIYANDWVKSCFKPLKGSITLSND